MYHPEQFNIEYVDTPSVPASAPMRAGCLAPGCPCRDARIVSHRRAAFYAAMARRNGQTADRVVPVEASWAFTWIVQATDGDTPTVGLAA